MADVLAVFAHPDDEVLGCGGTLAKHFETEGSTVVKLIAPRGLHEEAMNALRALGANVGRTPLEDGGWPDQKFDTLPFVELTEAVRSGGENPDIIYTHHPGDLNLDHALVARAVLTAFRPKPGQRPCRIMACEVASSTEWTFPQQFQPNWFEGLTFGQVQKKCDAMLCYPSETRQEPHPRNTKGIATAAVYRGQQAGVDYAEAFQLLRAGPF